MLSSRRFWAVMVIASCVNIFSVKFMHHLNIGSMVVLGCGYIIVIVVLSAMGTHHDASFVFTSFVNESGWSSNGVAWCLGLLTTSYGFVGYDAAAHMSEEMKNAARDVPRAMVGSVVISGILTFPYIIALLFAVGDIDDLLASPTGSPITQLFVNVTGSNAGGIALNCIITYVALVATTGTYPQKCANKISPRLVRERLGHLLEITGCPISCSSNPPMGCSCQRYHSGINSSMFT